MSMDCRLACGDEQTATVGAENGEGVFDPRIDAIFIEPLIGKPLTIEAQCGGCQSALAEYFLKACDKRSADTPDKLVRGRNIPIELFEGVLNGACDADPWVGRRSIAVEKIASMQPIFTQVTARNKRRRGD